MPRPVARYSVTSGLHGCYMPDNVSGPIIAHTRRDLMAVIRDELELAGFPKSAVREVKARRLWAYIKRHGSSVAHFTIVHRGREVAFHGLTEEEADQMEREGEG